MSECACGHVDDEHYWMSMGFAACEIDGCMCIQFEAVEVDDD